MTRRYPAYGHSGVEWLGEVPEGWSISALKHIVSTPITDGPHETPQFFDEGVPFVSAEAVSSGRINFDSIRGHISPEDNAKYSAKYSPKRNDIFMIKSGATTGFTAIVETDIEFNIWSPLAVVRCGPKAHPYYVLNFMRSQNFFEAVQLGWSFGTQQNIGMGVIENLNICLPPFPEQTAIAAFLDRETAKIDALVAEQRRLIDLLREKRQAVISRAVTKGLNPHARLKPSGIDWLGDVPEGWEVVPLKYLVSFKSGGTPRKDKLEYWEGEVPWASARDLKSEVLQDTALHISEAAVAEGAATLEPAGSIVVLVRGMTLAKTFPVCVAGCDMAINQDLKALWGNAKLTNDFLAWALRGLSSESLSRIDEAGHGTKALRMEAWTSMDLTVPSVKEQSAIVTFLTATTAKLDTLTATAESAIALLQERRAALISAAVTGKIDVRHLAPQETESA